jgi:transcription initiation factor TFIID subunit 11
LYCTEPPKRKKAKAEDDPNAPPKKPRKKKATDAEQVMGMGMDELVGLVKKEIVAAEENLEGVGVDDDEFMYQEGDAPRRAPAAPRLTEEGDDEGEDDDDSDDESDSHDEQPSEDDENDESDEEQMYNNARIQQQTEMRHIIDQFTPEQQDRYESFRRSRFPTAQIKRIMGQVAGVTVGQQTAIVMAGCTKLFVGELVETARTVQEEWANASGMTDSSVVLGPVSPAHIREAYRRLKEAGKVPYEKKERLFKR